jgi:hypothetical protein
MSTQARNSFLSGVGCAFDWLDRRFGTLDLRGVALKDHLSGRLPTSHRQLIVKAA